MSMCTFVFGHDGEDGLSLLVLQEGHQLLYIERRICIYVSNKIIDTIIHTYTAYDAYYKVHTWIWHLLVTMQHVSQ
jgi:hypothetical protein